MRKQTTILALALSGAVVGCQDRAPAGPDVPVAVQLATHAPLRDRYVVSFRDGVADAAGLSRRLVAENGGQLVHTYGRVLHGFAATLPASAVAALQKNPNVASVQPDGPVQGDGTVTQPGADWGLDRIDQRTLPLDGAYHYAQTGAGVGVYIVDSGIRYDHDEFGGRAQPGFDYLGGDGSDCATNPSGHGTHVAGIAAGATYGVARSSSIYSVRVLNCSAGGSYSDVIAGLDWIAANHVTPAVVNLSLSGASYDLLDAAVDQLIARVTAVVSAGTSAIAADDACGRSPSRVAAAITIGGTASTDARGPYSSFGDCVDWFAPGTSIRSASVSGPSATEVRTGTSQSTAFVSGVAAAFLQANPTATPAEVDAALRAVLTQHVVTNALSANDNLLYSLGNWSRPVAQITAPAAAAVFQAGASVAFAGSGTDTEDGPLSGASLVWTSNLQGQIGTGTSFSRTDLVSGTHTITLVATDAGGATGSASVSFRVNAAPTASFSYTCRGGTNCDFTDSSTDADGTIGSWLWSFGDGGSSTVRNPSHAFAGGTFTVKLTVTDNDAGKGTRSTTVQCAVKGKTVKCN